MWPALRNGLLTLSAGGITPLAPEQHLVRAAAWMTGVGVLLTVAISASTLSRLVVVKDPKDHLDNYSPEALETSRHLWWRVFYVRVVAASPLVIALITIVGICCPRVFEAPIVLSACYEVFAIWCFYWMVTSFIGNSPDEVLAALAKFPPQKLWSPCSVPRVFGPGDMFATKVLLWQYIFVWLLLAVLEACERLPMRFLVFRSLTFGLFLYGICTLMLPAHTCLVSRKVHLKFFVMKGVVIVSACAFRFSQNAAVHNLNRDRNLILNTADPHLQPDDSSHAAMYVAVQWAAGFTAVLVVPFALVGQFAFSADDFKDEFPVKHIA